MGSRPSKETLNVDENVSSYIVDTIDVLNSVKTWMNEIRKNLDSDIKQLRMNLESAKFLRNICNLHHEIKENRKLVGDQLAEYDAGRVFAGYIKFMTSYGTNTTTNRYDAICLDMIINVCWNFSDASRSFRLNLGRAGLFLYLVTSLHALYDQRHEETTKYVICGYLAILHNCARELENRKYFKQADAIKAVLPYTKTNCQLATVLSVLILAYLVEERDGDLISTNDYVIKFILERLKFAIVSPDHRAEGFSAEELVDGLANLANNESNKKKIVREGFLPLLVELMQNGSCSEQDAGAKMIWVLSFTEENKLKIRQEGILMKTLTNLSKATGNERAKGALWVLNESKALVDEKEISVRKMNESQIEKKKKSIAQPSSPRHIMISYQWNYKNIAAEIKKNLESRNYSVWMDAGDMKDFTLETMTKSVETSEVILICVSEAYKNSVTCRTEAEYAKWLKKCCVPILVEQDYHPDGWLGALVGSKFIHDFSGNDFFVRNFPKLIEELGEKGKCDSTDGVNDSEEA